MPGAVFAVDISKNWQSATIAVANANAELHETELVRSFINPTENQIFDELVRLYQTHSARAIAIDDYLTSNLAKRLKQAGIPTWQLWGKEMANACSSVFAMFAQGQVKHNNDQLLVAQMGNGVAKYTGDSWMISRKESRGEIDALMATVIALYVSSRAQHAGVQVF